MRHPIRPFPAVLALPLAFAACASPDEGAATGKTVDTAASQVEKGIVELEATLLSLKELVQKPAPDLKTQFKTFSSNLASLESTAKEVGDLATQIEERSQHFFELWDQHLASVQNEDIRERSAKRREEVAENFAKIKSEYTEVRDEFKPLLSDLRDVRTVLGTDLTLSGIKTVEDTVEDIEDEQEDVRESLQELAAKFRELGVDLSRAGPAVEAAVDAKK